MTSIHIYDIWLEHKIKQLTTAEIAFELSSWQYKASIVTEIAVQRSFKKATEWYSLLKITALLYLTLESSPPVPLITTNPSQFTSALLPTEDLLTCYSNTTQMYL